jgi:uncharacterized protein YyaL (SSP411 family)
VLRDMTDAGGGFYSAEDADSAMSPDHPDLKGEGAFYIWSLEEIRALVGQPAADWFCYRYGVREGSNVANDPHGEFTGKNILYQAHTVEETARHFSQPPGEVRPALDRAGTLLMAARAQRVRPLLDDKILTAWNGLMISAFAKGGAVLDGPRRRPLRRGRAARRRVRHRPHVRCRERQTAAALSRGRRRHPRLSRRLRHVRAGPARSLRSPVRPAPPGTGRAAHRKAAGAVRGRRRARSSAPGRTTTGWCCA